jgi:hypothetical protein
LLLSIFLSVAQFTHDVPALEIKMGRHVSAFCVGSFCFTLYGNLQSVQSACVNSVSYESAMLTRLIVQLPDVCVVCKMFNREFLMHLLDIGSNGRDREWNF